MSTAALATTCDLCGSRPWSGRSLPRTAVFDGRTRHFCCAGCLQVFTILHESGQLGNGAPWDTPPARAAREMGLIARPDSFGNADAREPVEEPLAEREVSLRVTGMWCPSCAWLIEHALLQRRGILDAQVLFASDYVRIRYDPSRLTLDRIRESVRAFGYDLAPFTEEEASPARRDSQRLLLRLGVAAILAMNVMALNLILYGELLGVAVEGDVKAAFPWICALLATPCVFWAGWPILERGARAAWRGSANMESLISISVLATYGYSLYVVLSGGFLVYFDTVTMLVALILTGKFLEALARERASHAVIRLYRRLPTKARLRAGGDASSDRFVPLDALAPGDRVVAGPRDALPADGRVIEGQATLDEAMLTGEARPIPKAAGDPVSAGTRVIDGEIVFRVLARGSDTRLARIIRAVEASLVSKSHAERRADRIARLFVPIVLGLALATLAYGMSAGLGTGPALIRAVTVLIISCPCSLGIATPLAMVAAVGRAAEKGILIRDSRALERAAGLRTLFLDKTGTLTRGEFGLRGIAVGDETLSPDQVLAWAAAAEGENSHPIASALRAAASQRGLWLPPADAAASLPGQGVRALVDGTTVLVGNPDFVGATSGSPPPGLEAWAREREVAGETVVLVARGGPESFRGVGALSLGDMLRPGAIRALQAVRALGMRTVLLSGDAPATTAAVARAAGVDAWEGGVSPEEKERLLEAARRDGAVAMLGDGINDAPALAAADVGIAVGSGADVALGAADITLLSADLSRVPEAIQLARRGLAIIRQNLFWAFVYNVVAIGLAMAGLFNPIFAATTMLLSSLSVTLNSLRLRKA
ncbi:MAG: heavy metal translocating P-type ATPase [Armatimonadetes bacterium]|nr:heavy metal translocating P-type ATPase [Armatimonadota bacterium]